MGLKRYDNNAQITVLFYDGLCVCVWVYGLE